MTTEIKTDFLKKYGPANGPYFMILADSRNWRSKKCEATQKLQSISNVSTADHILNIYFFFNFWKAKQIVFACSKQVHDHLSES